MAMWLYKEGERVEVTMPGHSSCGPYIPAVVLRPPSPSARTLVFIQYHRSLRDFVDPRLLRPSPPPDPSHRRFSPGDQVDAFRSELWFRGTVSEILSDSTYAVALNSGDPIVCQGFHLRIHRDWLPLLCSWVPPPPPPPLLVHDHNHDQGEASCASATRNKIRLKFVVRNKEIFECGSSVEVTSEDDGYKESWYVAKIIGSVATDKFLVEYRDLAAIDGPHAPPLREVAEKRHVRPQPPFAPSAAHFEKLQRVDAWYNDGWWAGVISKVEAGGQYVVYFRTTNEELMFRRSELRPHHDWINGKWTIASEVEEEIPSCAVVNSDAKAELIKGAKVEVKSDEAGYQGSWYEATIAEALRKDKYLVEYRTLRNDNETEMLKEEAKALDIRPCPPNVRRVHPYLLLENVDCWYNDGWWAGCIWKVLAGRKYTVYFSNTHEEIEFDHYTLRPHMEWVDGKWIYSHVI